MKGTYAHNPLSHTHTQMHAAHILFTTLRAFKLAVLALQSLKQREKEISVEPVLFDCLLTLERGFLFNSSSDESRTGLIAADVGT